MFTLCPQCEAVHALEARHIAQARGEVRCLRCGEHFNLLTRLFDNYPNQRRLPRYPSTRPPGLGEEDEKPRAPVTLEPRQEPPSRKVLWWSLAGVLALLTLINMVWTFKDDLPPDSALAGTLRALSVPGFEPAPEFRDPSRFHLITRDIHQHPTRSGVLVLSATFVNLADRAQPYPQMIVTLNNSEDRPVAARVFKPQDYLIGTWAPESRLAPNQQLPVLLEFADPGERATGFEIEFR